VTAGAEPIGDVLRRQRVDRLRFGLREMARKLEISAAHLTDIEKGRRSPSDELLMKIASAYSLDEAQLRAGWRKADAIVQEVATQDALAAKKVPDFLRMARHLTEEQWNQIIEKARRLAQRRRGGAHA